MPLALLAALAGSLAIHVAALFGTHLEPFGDEAPASPVILAEIRPLPAAPVLAKESPPQQQVQHRKASARSGRLAARKSPAAKAALVVPTETPITPDEPVQTAATNPLATPLAQDHASESASEQQVPQPLLPTEGVIRYVVSVGSQGFIAGKAEHRWQFLPDGTYSLRGVTETSGLVSVFKRLRYENESVGRLTSAGLVPLRYSTRKNGDDGNETADFDRERSIVHLYRDGSERPIALGTQDILSLNYQLAYLPNLANGAVIGVVTGKKYERYALDALGEEMLDTPAGLFRTLHLRAATDTVTEIWIALDHYRLPVKIRFIDKKGDQLEQVASEIGAIAE